MQFSKKTYDLLKALAMLWLPGAGALYSAVAGLWGLPDVTQVVGSIVAVDTFLGLVLKLSTNGYQPVTQGTVALDETDGHPVAIIQFHAKSDEELASVLRQNSTLTFNVSKILPEQIPASKPAMDRLPPA